MMETYKDKRIKHLQTLTPNGFNMKLMSCLEIGLVDLG